MNMMYDIPLSASNSLLCSSFPLTWINIFSLCVYILYLFVISLVARGSEDIFRLDYGNYWVALLDLVPSLYGRVPIKFARALLLS
jgi:hypothetical protein